MIFIIKNLKKILKRSHILLLLTIRRHSVSATACNFILLALVVCVHSTTDGHRRSETRGERRRHLTQYVRTKRTSGGAAHVVHCGFSKGQIDARLLFSGKILRIPSEPRGVVYWRPVHPLELSWRPTDVRRRQPKMFRICKRAQNSKLSLRNFNSLIYQNCDLSARLPLPQLPPHFAAMPFACHFFYNTYRRNATLPAGGEKLNLHACMQTNFALTLRVTL